MNTILPSKIKKIIPLIIILCFYNCQQDDACNKKCNGFDITTPIYEWYLFPSNPSELKFINTESDILTLNQNFTGISEPCFIERSCFSLFTSNDCNEFILANYESNNYDISNNINFFDQDEVISYRLEFNSNVIRATFKNNQFSNDDDKINEYSFTINDKVLSIKINEDYRREGLSEIWIQKNNGLIAFKINDIIWTKDI